MGSGGAGRGPRGAGAGLRGLAIATLVAWVIALTVPSRTTVAISVTAQGAQAQVNGARLTLDIPAARVAAGGHWGWYVAPPSESLYYEPADSSAPLAELGRLGEALQQARPAAHWEFAPAASTDTAAYHPAAARPFAEAAGLAAAEDPTSRTTPGAHLAATLVGGRVPAGLFVALDAGHNGYAFVIRPERRSIAWWTVTADVPTTVVTDGLYRPGFWAGAADLAQEAALALSGALALAWLALGLAALWARVRPRAPRAPPSARARRGRANLLSKIRHAGWPLAFGLAALLATAAICLGPLDGIPHVQDDVAYFWQAKIFALRTAWVPAPPGPEFFEQGFILITGGHWFTKYPPGWPLLLVPGVWTGLPWLINPLCAGAALALVAATGRRLYGAAAGVWAAVLGLSSPFFLFMSGSFMSHPSTMLATAAALYCFARLKAGVRDRASRFTPHLLALGAGFALAWAFITREATAVGVALPFLVWAALDSAGALLAAGRERGPAGAGRRLLGRVLPYAEMVIGALPPLVVLGVVNQILLGSPFRFAQELVGSYDQLGFGPGFGPEPGGHSPALGLSNALVYLRTLEGLLFGWPLPLTFGPLLIALAATWGRGWARARWDLFLLGGFLGLAGIYFAWWSATTIYGPRYWYEALPFLWLLSGRGVQRLGQVAAAQVYRRGAPGARAAAIVVPAVLIGGLLLFDAAQVLPGQVRAYTGYNDVTASSFQRVAAAHLGPALVFVALNPAFPRRDFGKVFFANDPLLRGPVVYVRDLGAARNRGLLGAFPGRAPYYLPLTGPPRPGVGP